MGFFQEFKEFAMKGNAVDMAVGIIIGASFNKVVSSLVNDIIMPPLGVMIGGVDFRNLAIELTKAAKDSAGNEIPAQTLRYGLFINNVIDFLIMTLTVFVVVKFMNKMMTSARLPGFMKKPAAPPA